MASLVSIFVQPKRAEISALTLDASVQEVHSAEATPTTNEIEDGSLISDHITLQPKKLVIVGTVSKTPITVISSAGGLAATAVGSAVGGIAAGIATAAVGSLAGVISGLGAKSPTDVYNYLIELCDNRIPFTVITALKEYGNMVITSVSATRRAIGSGALNFTANLQQVTIVKTEVFGLPEGNIAADAAASAAGAANLGNQAAKAASESTASNASIAYRGAASFGLVGQ
jgi:hypothetical protein